MKWEYIDEVAALVLIIGCIILLATGIDGEVKSILAMAAAWAFKGGFDRTKKRRG